MRVMRNGQLSTKGIVSMARRNRPIIVEGPDGSGKTTLAKKLSDLYGLEYSRPPEAVLSSTKGPGGIALVDWWNNELASDGLSKKVYDRCFFISDPIYQQAQASRDLLIDGPQLVRGIMKLWNVEPIIIFCLPPWEVQIANVRQKDRGRLEGVGDNALLKISNAYWAYYAMWSNGLFENIRLYNYTDENSWGYLEKYLETFGLEAVDGAA